MRNRAVRLKEMVNCKADRQPMTQPLQQRQEHGLSVMPLAAKLSALLRIAASDSR